MANQTPPTRPLRGSRVASPVTDRPLRVLLVEDDAMNRALVRAILSRQDPLTDGVVLREAETLAAARQILATERIDVALLDVRLRDGSGLDLAEELRSGSFLLDRAGGIPLPLVAIISGSLVASERDQAEALGVAFLAKPYMPRELVDVLERFRREVETRSGSASAVLGRTGNEY